MTANDRQLSDSHPFRPEFTTGTSLVTLSVAQGFLIVAVWLVAWPGTIRVPLGGSLVGISGFLSGASAIGFYLGFVSLWRNSSTIRR
ncbi:MAG TPA: hypothetical protein VJ898_13415 [Natrialbaceae archaeon]|nr:hypothetical protein [Natrialbaceae archaeon]